MTQTVFTDATVELMDYQEFLDYAANALNYDGQTELLLHVNSRLRSMPYNPSSSLTTKEQWAEQIISEMRSNGYEIQYNGNNQWTSSVFPSTAQVSTTNPVNSNAVTVSRGRIRSWYGGLNEFDPSNMQFWKPQRMPVSGGLGSKAMYFLGSIGSGVAAASTGIWLGKTFDATLYNAMPNFWDSIGWSSLNPETWSGLTNGSNSPFAGMLNFLLGIDGTNGDAQAYMSEDMLAYLAYAMYKNGVFATGDYKVETNPDASVFTNVHIPIYGNIGSCTRIFDDGKIIIEEDLTDTTAIFFVFGSCTTAQPFSTCVATKITGTHNYLETTINPNGTISTRNFTRTFGNNDKFTYNNEDAYCVGANSAAYVKYASTIPEVTASYWDRKDIKQQGWLVLYNAIQSQPIQGIGNQDGATLPDTTGWDDLNNVLPSLQQQYPDAFQNPMVWNTDTPYDDTAGNQTRYIPVPFPMANSATDTQPISGTQTQTNTSLNTTPQEILDLITKTIQQTDTQPATPPTNPTDTGTGSTATPTAPTGNASALWSVYHPSQSEVDAFGAWLWGSPFLTNIGKLFQNPIDGVISLHKIFATPVDSGTGTIVVGTLDSGVSSATVDQQYVYIDCGTVNCYENFGNVFDYSPHTQVSLYLPFIGIVPLDVNDVMRSSINVTYGVDVYTGACLAMVSVSRDGNTVNMYQYAGVASVEYPLSNVQNGQLISGLLAIGAGVASMVATGGVTAPAVGAVVGGVAASSNSSVGKSGGFSGNSGAMGGKIPYLILQRPQTKIADSFIYLNGYPTNVSGKLSDFSGQVTVKHVHVEGIAATDKELIEIESLLKSGILI